ncbi:hypothetical protein RMO59_26225, partial [Streptomyces alfalfae]
MITYERSPERRPVLAVDQGTSGTKALVVCPERGVIGSGAAEVRPRFLPGGLVEADPADPTDPSNEKKNRP